MVNNVRSDLGDSVEKIMQDYSHKGKSRLELVYNGRRIDLRVAQDPAINQYDIDPQDLKSIRRNRFNGKLQLEELSFINGMYKLGFSEDHDLYFIFNEQGIWKTLSVEKHFMFEDHLEVGVDNVEIHITNRTNNYLHATIRRSHPDGRDGFIYLPQWFGKNESFQLESNCYVELRPNYSFFSPLIFSLRRIG